MSSLSFCVSFDANIKTTHELFRICSASALDSVTFMERGACRLMHKLWRLYKRPALSWFTEVSLPQAWKKTHWETCVTESYCSAADAALSTCCFARPFCEIDCHKGTKRTPAFSAFSVLMVGRRSSLSCAPKQTLKKGSLTNNVAQAQRKPKQRAGTFRRKQLRKLCVTSITSRKEKTDLMWVLISKAVLCNAS